MIVEDGTIVNDANSYVTVSYADSFHNDRANSSWTGTDAVKEAALIKATDYIEQVYEGRWVGYLVDNDQPLSWPRTYNVNGSVYVDYDISGDIPKRLKQAVCILALESLSGELNPVLDRAVKREKVDVIEVEYMDGASDGKRRPAITGLLRPYLKGSAWNAPAVRV